MAFPVVSFSCRHSYFVFHFSNIEAISLLIILRYNWHVSFYLCFICHLKKIWPQRLRGGSVSWVPHSWFQLMSWFQDHETEPCIGLWTSMKSESTRDALPSLYPYSPDLWSLSLCVCLKRKEKKRQDMTIKRKKNMRFQYK